MSFFLVNSDYIPGKNPCGSETFVSFVKEKQGSFLVVKQKGACMSWYKQDVDQVVKALDTNTSTGLSNQEVEKRLDQYGRNELKEGKKKSFGKKLLDQFLDPMILILLAASILSALMGEWVDSAIIIAIVIVNAILSLYQEGQAEKAIEALQKMSSPKAKLLREGRIEEVDSGELVPGDLVLLETGDIVPADLRLVETTNLKIDESSLTGESVAVEKDAQKVFEEKVGLGDRENLAFSSSIVSYGRAKGLVVATGEETEIGKIATSLSQVEDEQTPLQKKLASLSKFLGILVVGICILVFLVGVFYKLDLIQNLLTSVSLAVAAIPEGLPAIVTIVLSLGMGRMAKKNAIVKKLLAVETLGTTTVICSDKTGTLTQNEMTVQKAYAGGQGYEISGSGYAPEGKIQKTSGEEVEVKESPLERLMHIALLANDASLEAREEGYKMSGDPTEGALLSFAGKADIVKEDLEENYPRVKEIPFDSVRKMMTTFHEVEGEVYSYTKGAPDIVLGKSAKILTAEGVRNLTEEDREEILKINSSYAKEALRVLAFAMKAHETMPESPKSEEDEEGMIFVGLVGMIDPARPEVRDAIKECKNAGITPIMITGDYLETAVAIAKDLGIAQSTDQAMSGKEIDELSPEELKEALKTKRVFARVSPENKVEIVTALKELGHITAMTGDGVNDAPAIKRADIGIAMGITGTDVAKNTAEVILTDDNFATIVNAVEEGRIIYANIKKFVSFLLSCNIGEVLVILIAILMNVPVPLIPIQLLWLNLLTDSFPALALGMEKGEDDVMYEPPRDPAEPILDKEITITVAIQSIAITISTLGAYLIGLNRFGDTGIGLDSARTMAFATLILSELLRSYSARSVNFTLAHIGVFSNPSLVKATLFSFVLMVLVMYVPFLEDLFHLVDLGFKEWIVILIGAFLPLLLGEIQKVIRFRKIHEDMKK